MCDRRRRRRPPQPAEPRERPAARDAVYSKRLGVAPRWPRAGLAAAVSSRLLPGAGQHADYASPGCRCEPALVAWRKARAGGAVNFYGLPRGLRGRRDGVATLRSSTTSASGSPCPTVPLRRDDPQVVVTAPRFNANTTTDVSQTTRRDQRRLHPQQPDHLSLASRPARCPPVATAWSWCASATEPPFTVGAGTVTDSTTPNLSAFTPIARS